MNPKYPIYIPSKGRYDSRLTIKTLDEMKVPYYVIVEEQEYDKYAEHVDKDRLLILPYSFKEDYDTCDNLGLSKSTGSGPARNYGWHHAKENGFKRYWIIDDNIRFFYRFHKNAQIPVSDGAIFKAMEDFCDRYTNVGMAGPQYHMFAVNNKKMPPITFNTRVFSCILVNTNMPFRWAGRYNEDVHLSIRSLKKGYCNLLFNAFLQGKMNTQVVKGGNTSELYFEGTKPKSEMIVKLHPDICQMAKRYNRWHHTVNFKKFKNIKLIKKKINDKNPKVNNYGMKLKKLKEKP